MKQKLFTLFLALAASVGTMTAKEHVSFSDSSLENKPTGVEVHQLRERLPLSKVLHKGNTAPSQQVNKNVPKNSPATSSDNTKEGVFVDDAVIASAFGLETLSWKVQYQTEELNDGLIELRIINPYACMSTGQDEHGLYDGYPYNDPGDWDESKDYNLVLHINPVTGKVVFVTESNELGVDWSYGMMFLYDSNNAVGKYVAKKGRVMFDALNQTLSFGMGNNIYAYAGFRFYLSVENYLADNITTKLGDLYYTFDEEAKTAEVMRSAELYSGEITIPESVVNNTITYSVTGIDEFAFRNCSGLTSVTIPVSMTSIGDGAFSGCSALTSVVWNAEHCNDFSSKSPFDGLSVLDFTFGTTVRYIPRVLCYKMKNLTSVTIPDGVTTIGSYAFGNCSNLASVSIPNSVTIIDYMAFGRDSALVSINLPNSLTNMGAAAFFACTSLKEITIPENVTTIGQGGTFQECAALTKVQWNAKNCTIEPYDGLYDYYWPFYNTNVTEFTFGDEVESIPPYLCGGLSGLTIINLPNSVTTIGEGAFSGCTGLTSPIYNSKLFVLMPESFEGSYDIPSGIEIIHEYAFSGCNKLSAVTIPNNVNTIERHAFAECKGVTSITIPDEVTTIGSDAFAGVPNIVYHGTATGAPWSALSMNGEVDGWFVYSDESKTHLLACSTSATGEIIIPESVTHIGNYAFYKCSGITTIAIPNSVTHIGDDAFERCVGITSVTIPEGVTNIGKHAFYMCSGLTSIVLPQSVTSIDDFAFGYCSNLSSINFHNHITNIGDGIFYGCENLLTPIYTDKVFVYLPKTYSGDYTIPSCIERIAGFAFQSCSNLTSVTLPEGLTKIGMYAFTHCTDLSSVNIPNSVTEIGQYAFDYCIKLSSITLPPNITIIKDATFADCPITNIVIPNGVDSICFAAFQFCKELTEITLPDNLKYIGVQAFNGCSKLTSITLPDNVHTILGGAFGDCTGLISLTLPSSVTYLGTDNGTSWGGDPFRGCTNLAVLACKAVIPPICSIVSFETIDKSIPVYVPAESIDAYKAADQWKDFTNIQPISGTEIPTEGTCGKDLQWSFDKVTGILTITGSGDMYNYSSESDVPWYPYQKAITMVLLPDELTTIGRNAFAGCSGITEIIIPSAVTSIGHKAFADCLGLVSITIPKSVISLGIYAFNGCTGLQNFYVDAENPIFCAIEGVLFNKDTTTIVRYPIGKTDAEYSIPVSVDSIGKSAFDGCANVRYITIPGSVTAIGYEAFINCISLTSIIIPSSVKVIHFAAFAFCSNLVSITCLATTPPAFESYEAPEVFTGVDKSIPVYVPAASIVAYKAADQWTDFTNFKSLPGEDAFSGNCGAEGDGSNLKWSLDINTGVLTITGSGVMADSAKYLGWHNYRELITSVQLPEGLTQIGREAFMECKAIHEVIIPDSVKAIAPKAFYNCSGLTSLNLPDSVHGIGYNAFVGCTGLTEPIYNIRLFGYMPRTFEGRYTIQEVIVAIAAFAFEDCIEMTAVTIPSTMKRIGEQSFANCTGLTAMACHATTPPTCNTNAFANVDKSIPVYVPAESIDAYKAADQWKEFTNILPEEESTLPTTYTITFVNDDGQVLDRREWEENATPFCEEPTKTDGEYIYCFTGWSPEIAKVTETATYQATYEVCGGWLSDKVYWKLQSDTLVVAGTGVIPDYQMPGIAPWTKFDSRVNVIYLVQGISRIGENAFANMSANTIHIAKSVTTIGRNAFEGCISTQKVDFDGTPCEWAVINFVNEYANPLCYGARLYAEKTLVTNACIPVTEYISTTSFIGMSEVHYQGTLAQWCGTQFIPNGEYEYDLYIDGVLVENPCMGEELTKISAYAFCGCRSLKSICIPAAMREIGADAFKRTPNLEKVLYAGSVKQWCSITFANAEANPTYHAIQFYIDSVLLGDRLEIPEPVTTIHAFAFPNTQKLDVYFRGTNPSDYFLNSFGEPLEVGNKHFYVPCGTKDEYQKQLNYSEDLFTEYYHLNYEVSSVNDSMGVVEILHAPTCEEPELLIQATPNDGYYFSMWSDSITANLRSIVLTQDTLLEAIFGPCLSYNINMHEVICQGDTFEFNGLACTSDTIAKWYGKDIHGCDSVVTLYLTVNKPTDMPVEKATICGGDYYEWHGRQLDKAGLYYDTVRYLESGCDSIRYTLQLRVDTVADEDRHLEKMEVYEGQELEWRGRTYIITQDTVLRKVYRYESGCDSAIYTCRVTVLPIPTYTVVVTPDDDLYGSVQGGGTYKQGETVTLTAVPNEGYVFAKWSNDTTANPYQFIVTEDIKLVAFFQKKQAEEAEVVEPEATPTDISVVITWPTIDNAVVYTIEIRKNGELICTLSFNAMGQLIGIAFAPSRDGNRDSQSRTATQTSTGWQYTVNGLEPNTTYTYSVTAKKEDDSVAYENTVEFTTEAPQAIDEISGQQSDDNSQKILHKGQLLILHNGDTFNATGARVE